jgi:putative membrane-bound dehydrogenase-like protein
MRALVICTGLGLGLAAALAAQETPDKSASDLKVAAGLQAALWAEEPMVMNPTNMAIDERGRVWVLEAVNYRRMLRHQPDLRPAGDRIMILEDTDHDGRADRSTVFDQNPGIRAPLGIAVLGDKVYVSQSPNLTVYTKDANDHILKKEILLTGFGGVDHDHGVHAVVFGPDGRYYFNQGNTGFSVTDRSGRTVQGSSYENQPLNSPTAGYFQGVVYRMNPDGTNLDVLAQNFRNPFELTVDSFGNIFQTDNDDDGNAWTRLAYVMEGGNYGYYGPLHHSWTADRSSHFHNELPGVVPNVLRLGAGSPTGILLYEGDLLPDRYRGRLIHAEAGKRYVAAYPLTDDGAGFRATIDEIVFGGPDTWFRPSDVAVSPDGALFVSDWYDPGVGGHNMGDPEGARGRIYRVAPTGNRPRIPAVDLATDTGLTAAFDSPTQDVRYLAYQALVARGAAAAPLLERLWHQPDPILRARALWILGGLPDAGAAAVAEALHDPDPRFRMLGLRVARRHAMDVLALAQPLLHDPSAQVRREIALLLRDTNPARMIPPYLSGLQVTPPDTWLDSMMTLIGQYDGHDRWYLEALGIAARGREDAIYARLHAMPGAATNWATAQVVWELRPKAAIPDLVATIHDASAPDGVRTAAVDTLGSMEWPEATRAIEAFIAAGTTPPDLGARAFAAYAHQLFSLWPDARTSTALPGIVRRALTVPANQTAAVDLVGRLLDPAFLPDLAALARSSAADPEARAAAISLLATTGDARYLDPFRTLAVSGPVPVRIAAIRGVGAVSATVDPVWAQSVLLGDAPNEVRVEALRQMATSAAGLTAILTLAEQGRLPGEFRTLAASLTNTAGQGRGGGRGRGGFASLNARGGGPGPGRAAGPDPAMAAIRARAATVLPLPMTTTLPITSIAALERNYRGNADAGRQVFTIDAGCAGCHSLGGPPKLGPDLSAIGAKYGKQALLDHILRPSDAIGNEYVVTTITLKDGESISGIASESTAQEVVVKTGPADERRLRVADIASRRTLGTSLMPEGLLNSLNAQQISDLLEFLASEDGHAR